MNIDNDMRHLTADEIASFTDILSATTTSVAPDGTITSLKVPGASLSARQVLLEEMRAEYERHLRQIRVLPETIPELRALLTDYIRRAFVEPGDNVGLDTAMSLFVFVMQMTLDSHKSSGAYKKTSSDTERITQILNTTANVPAKSMDIHFQDKELTMDEALLHRQYIEDARLANLAIKYEEVLTQEYQEEWQENAYLMSYMAIYGYNPEIFLKSIYSVQVVFESYKLYTHGKTPTILATAMNSRVEAEGNSEPSIVFLPYVYINDEGNKVDSLIIVINASAQKDDINSQDPDTYGIGTLEYINKIVRPHYIEGATISGVRGVERVIPKSMPLSSYLGASYTGQYEVGGEMYNNCLVLNVTLCRACGITGERFQSLFDVMGIPSVLDESNGDLSPYILYVQYKRESGTDSILAYLQTTLSLPREETNVLPWVSRLSYEEVQVDDGSVAVRVSGRADMVANSFRILQHRSQYEIQMETHESYLVYDLSRGDLIEETVRIAKNLVTYNYLQTEGSNIVDTALLPFVDADVIRTNNYHEVNHAMGIIGFRRNILQELNDIIANIGTINQHHVELFVDQMTVRGIPLPVNEVGLEMAGKSQFVVAAKSAATDQLARAAMYGVTERTNRESAALIFADTARVGTGMSDVKIDREMITKRFGEEEAKRIIEYLATNNMRITGQKKEEEERRGLRFTMKEAARIKASSQAEHFAQVLAILSSTRDKEEAVANSKQQQVAKAITNDAPQQLMRSTHAKGTYRLTGRSMSSPLTDHDDAITYARRVSKLLWNEDSIIPTGKKEDMPAIKSYSGAKYVRQTNEAKPVPLLFKQIATVPSQIPAQNIYDYNMYSRIDPIRAMRAYKMGSYNIKHRVKSPGLKSPFTVPSDLLPFTY